MINNYKKAEKSLGVCVACSYVYSSITHITSFLGLEFLGFRYTWVQARSISQKYTRKKTSMRFTPSVSQNRPLASTWERKRKTEEDDRTSREPLHVVSEKREFAWFCCKLWLWRTEQLESYRASDFFYTTSNKVRVGAVELKMLNIFYGLWFYLGDSSDGNCRLSSQLLGWQFHSHAPKFSISCPWCGCHWNPDERVDANEISWYANEYGCVKI